MPLTHSITVDGSPSSLELLIGGGTDRSDRGDTNHDDQRQQNRVLDSGGTVFFLQEINNAGAEILHSIFPSLSRSIGDPLRSPTGCITRSKVSSPRSDWLPIFDTVNPVSLAGVRDGVRRRVIPRPYNRL